MHVDDNSSQQSAVVSSSSGGGGGSISSDSSYSSGRGEGDNALAGVQEAGVPKCFIVTGFCFLIGAFSGTLLGISVPSLLCGLILLCERDAPLFLSFFPSIFTSLS